MPNITIHRLTAKGLLSVLCCLMVDGEAMDTERIGKDIFHCSIKVHAALGPSLTHFR
jgi:hypothetical protein